MERIGKTIREVLKNTYAGMQGVRGVSGDISLELQDKLEEAQEHLIKVVSQWSRFYWGTVDVFGIEKGDKVKFPPKSFAVCCNYEVDISGQRGVVVRNDFRYNEDGTPDEDAGCHIKLDQYFNDFDEWDNVVQFGEGGTPVEVLEGVEVLTDIVTVEELLEMTPIAMEGFFNRYFPNPNDKSHYIDHAVEIYDCDSNFIKDSYCESCGTKEHDKPFYIGTDDTSEPVWCEEHYAEIYKYSEFHKLKPEEQEEEDIRKELEVLGWYYGGTGGGCDAYFYDIDKEDETHLLMTELECGVETPSRRTQKVYIGIYGDKDSPSYNAIGFICKVEDILTERIRFDRT